MPRLPRILLLLPHLHLCTGPWFRKSPANLDCKLQSFQGSEKSCTSQGRFFKTWKIHSTLYTKFHICSNWSKLFTTTTSALMPCGGVPTEGPRPEILKGFTVGWVRVAFSSPLRWSIFLFKSFEQSLLPITIPDPSWHIQNFTPHINQTIRLHFGQHVIDGSFQFRSPCQPVNMLVDKLCQLIVRSTFKVSVQCSLNDLVHNGLIASDFV